MVSNVKMKSKFEKSSDNSNAGKLVSSAISQKEAPINITSNGLFGDNPNDNSQIGLLMPDVGSGL
jgi:hypothetical protein